MELAHRAEGVSSGELCERLDCTIGELKNRVCRVRAYYGATSILTHKAWGGAATYTLNQKITTAAR